MRILVTGGAGFLGSHLCERLLADGHEVMCYDSLITGDFDNVEHLMDEDGFTYLRCDVTEFLDVVGELDWVMHLAAPASPADYMKFPIETLRVGSIGTLNALELAKRKGCGFFLASTSEVYGDPLVNPQPETYWGNVNPTGPRSMYDESKRFAEALTYAFHRTESVPVRVVRIFNTYGPRMRRREGRAVPNFVDQALQGEPVTVHGDGSQTRSLCYVEDLIEGLIRLLHSNVTDPVNIGNPHEITILDLAQTIRRLTKSSSEIVFVERRPEDPLRRQPDITRAKTLLEWSPAVDLEVGLARTIEWARASWGRAL